MGKVIKLKESELHEIIKEKIQEALEHNVDLEYSPAIGNKKRGPGKDTTDQMKKRKNTKLDEDVDEKSIYRRLPGGDLDYEGEDSDNSVEHMVSLTEDSYAYGFEQVYGRVPGNLSDIMEENELPDEISVLVSINTSDYKGDYESPSYSESTIEDWSVSDQCLSRFGGELRNVILKAVEYEMENVDADELATELNESISTVRLSFTGLQNLIAESVKNIISNLCEEDEESVSKSQQRLFGMVDAYKKGEMKNAPKKIKDIAKGMSMKDVKDFAETKHKGLPNRVKKSKK